MNDIKIRNILTEIRQKLINYLKENNIQFTFKKQKNNMKLIDTFPIKCLKSPFEIYNGCNIHGITLIDVNNWINIETGIKVADLKSMEIKEMKICIRNFHDELYPIEAIIHTFLHELAHTVTLPELVLSKNITNRRKKIQPTVENKKNNHYMPNHHSDSFYCNFARLLRIAENLEIYQLPKSHRTFTIKSLQRFDSLF